MANPPAKNWRLLPHDRSAVEALSRALQLSPLVAQLLLNRGLTDADDARRFLTPSLKGLHRPDLLPGVPEAVERIMAAVAAGRRISVYGDYDVDGVSGSAILLLILRQLGAKPSLYLPNRLSEGYGLNRAALKQIADEGASLVVTVDCGIAAVAEAEEAERLGLELIVTDHHEMKATLPRASVLVHPRLPGSEYPFGQLCGAGVALKLAWALAMKACGGEKVTEAFRKTLMECVGLATLGVVADVVPLVDENRILVKAGLVQLRDAPPVGFTALCQAAKVDTAKPLRASDIGYRLAPRINAAGRLGEASIAVDLLTTTRREPAADMARRLELLNEARQNLERESVARAKHLIETEGHDRRPAIVLAADGWHGGVVGIVAGRLAEQYGKPTLMITLPKGDTASMNDHERLAVGSGRSIAGLALHEALHECREFLVGHGGHAMAAGFRFHPEKLDAFREKFCEVVAGTFPHGVPTPTLVLDAETPLSALTLGLVADIDKLEPYGAENRRPVFLAGDLKIQGTPRRIGQGERHLSFQVVQGKTLMRAIAWGMGDRLDAIMSGGGAISLAFTPIRNEFRGQVNVELEVQDFQVGPQARLV